MCLKSMLFALVLCFSSAAHGGVQYGVVCNTPFAAANYLLQRKGDTRRDHARDAKKVSTSTNWCIAGYVKESREKTATRDVHYAAEMLMYPHFIRGFPEKGDAIGTLLWNIALFVLPNEEVMVYEYVTENTGKRMYYMRYDG